SVGARVVGMGGVGLYGKEVWETSTPVAGVASKAHEDRRGRRRAKKSPGLPAMKALPSTHQPPSPLQMLMSFFCDLCLWNALNCVYMCRPLPYYQVRNMENQITSKISPLKKMPRRRSTTLRVTVVTVLLFL